MRGPGGGRTIIQCPRALPRLDAELVAFGILHNREDVVVTFGDDPHTRRAECQELLDCLLNRKVWLDVHVNPVFHGLPFWDFQEQQAWTLPRPRPQHRDLVEFIRLAQLISGDGGPELGQSRGLGAVDGYASDLRVHFTAASASRTSHSLPNTGAAESGLPASLPSRGPVAYGTPEDRLKH